MNEFEIIPVKTRILTHEDDIIKAVKEYCVGKAGSNDVICVAESVVAITQGRFLDINDIKPKFAAKLLCKFFPVKGSLSTRYAMQALMDAEGTKKVIYAFIIGSLSRLVGMHGVFYKMAGDQSRLIDDFSGTMPPYDKYMVFGPENPSKVAEEIASAVGCYGAAVADVNDLKRADVLGVSAGVDKRWLSKILIDNPFGNGSEKTPIVIIKDYPEYVTTLRMKKYV